MGLLQRITTVSGGRMQAHSVTSRENMWVSPEGWIMQLRGAGMRVSPELAMTLSAVYCAVTTIADDIATMPCQLMRYVGDDGDKERARNHPIAYLLRWQPNSWQTSKEFWSTMIGHVLLRNVAFAEIVPGPRGAVDQLIPRHPDRILQERLPNGRIRYRLLGQFDVSGQPKVLTQAEMFVLRELTSDGLTGLSRIAYGAQALGSAIAQERFTAKFFEKGATAALVATHKGGELGEEDEAALHSSLTRYASGVENAGGILVIEDDISISQLGVDPDKAQLLGLKDYSVREVARLFKMPGHKLEASQQTQAYAAREQANLEYVTGCLRPIVVGIEQAIQRDLVIAKDTYFGEFLMEALLRGDLKSRADYYSKAILNRWMWPSEVRRREGMNADAELDTLSRDDHRAGASRDGQGNNGQNAKQIGTGRTVKATLMAHDNAVRLLRRERHNVEKLAKKHANDVPGWQTSLREFYAEHAQVVAETMRMETGKARAYAAQHGSQLEAQGIVVMDAAWEREEAEELVALSLETDRKAA